MKMEAGIVIPTYNERENIQELIPEIFKVARRNRLDIRVLVVDDSSPDGTYEVVKNLGKKFNVTLLKRKKKMGIGSAYVAGFRFFLKKKTDLVFEMDADLSHDPRYLPMFFNKIKGGYDLVIGSRYVRGGKILGWGMTRKAVSSGGNFVGRIIAGLGVKDITAGYRCYRRNVLEKINLNKVKSTGYSFQLEMVHLVKMGGFSIAEIPITFHNREVGKSKLSKSDILNFLMLAIKIRFGLD